MQWFSDSKHGIWKEFVVVKPPMFLDYFIFQQSASSFGVKAYSGFFVFMVTFGVVTYQYLYQCITINKDTLRFECGG